MRGPKPPRVPTSAISPQTSALRLMSKQMLINYVPGEECRIAITNHGKLEEFYQERASDESHVGNIYAGKVTNVEPAIQAAFVDFGLERNGFLHVSDLHPRYFPGKDREAFEKVGSKTPRRERPPIQKCFRRGDRVLVQVLKEGIGTKGPTLTSYLSIPGRYLVMMPYMQRLGVTRKVDDDDARRAARDILKELAPPEDMGFIVRTAGVGQTKTELKRDLSYLLRLWKLIEKRQKAAKRTGELYAESDLMIRTIRDVFTTEIDRIVIDDATAATRARDFLKIANPRSQSKLVLYDDPVPLMHRFDVERQLRGIQDREVPLPSGGSLVFDQAEALVAIDVNSGKSRDARDAETNALETNKEAVDEIARQLRLRDMGGVVVCDLIDMMAAKNRRAIEQRFRAAMKSDRARTRLGSISQFGLVELTRQRMRPSLRKSIYIDCDHCHGMGHVRSAESTVLDVMRDLAVVLQRPDVHRVELTISPDVAFQVLNRKRRQLTALENRFVKDVLVRVGGRSIDFVHIDAYDDRGGQINPDRLFDLKHLKADDDAVFREVEGAGISDRVTVDDDDELPETPDVTPPEAAVPSEDFVEPPAVEDDSTLERGDLAALDEKEQEAEAAGKKRKRRRRGGRRRKKKGEEGSEEQETGSEQGAGESAAAGGGEAKSEKTRKDDAAGGEEASSPQEDDQASQPDKDDKPKRRSRSRGGRRRKKSSDQAGPSSDDAAESSDEEAGKPGDDPPSDADASGDETDGDGEGKPKKKRRRSRAGSRPKSKDKDKDKDKNQDNSNDGDGKGNDKGSDHGDAAAPANGDTAAGRGYSNRVIADGEPPPKPQPDPAAPEPGNEREPQPAAEPDA